MSLPRKKSLRDYCAAKAARNGQKPRSAIKSRKPLARVSSARRIAGKVYSDRRKKFMEDNPNCAAKLECCTGMATECHHSNGREGKNYLDVSTWIPLCASCHRFVHLHPRKARELGLLR